METTTQTPTPVPARLGLWDTTSIIVGIIIGAGIFETPAQVFRNASGPAAALGLWALGGLLSLVGALCFAELASTYPRSGGEYVFLTRAYGRPIGFLFGWSQLAVVRTGGIAALAYVFAHYVGALWGFRPESGAWVAAGAIAVLSLINMLGVTLGKETQNILTIAKLAGLGTIVVVGFLSAQPKALTIHHDADETPSLALALILVFFTYDGWNEAANVAAEVQGRRRTLPLALILGTAAVTLTYLLVNGAYLVGLGFETARNSSGEMLPGGILALALGKAGFTLMGLLVMVSVLGSINGTILTSARIYAEVGTEHRVLAPLGRWDPRWGTPLLSLGVQGCVSIAMVVGVGLWRRNRDSFETVVSCTAPVFWLFFLLTGAALIVLRYRDRDVERPFRVPGYPLLPLLFCGMCAFMLHASFEYSREKAPHELLTVLAVALTGIPLYFVSRGLGRPRPAPAWEPPLAVVPREEAAEVSRTAPG
jgi:amino acid transporter